MREFTWDDVGGLATPTPHINTTKEELEYNPPDWMRRGLQETRSGYGSRLNSGYMIHFEGRVYRVYVTCYSNCGTPWFKVRGKEIFIRG